MKRKNKDQDKIREVETKQIIQKNNETKSWFFEKINKFDNP
jgi:hypothetical protein